MYDAIEKALAAKIKERLALDRNACVLVVGLHWTPRSAKDQKDA